MRFLKVHVYIYIFTTHQLSLVSSFYATPITCVPSLRSSHWKCIVVIIVSLTIKELSLYCLLLNPALYSPSYGLAVEHVLKTHWALSLIVEDANHTLSLFTHHFLSSVLLSLRIKTQYVREDITIQTRPDFNMISIFLYFFKSVCNVIGFFLQR